jgi:hypothetical protein
VLDTRAVSRPPTPLPIVAFLLVFALACSKKDDSPLCYRGPDGFCACGGDWPAKDRTLETCSAQSVGSNGVCCNSKDSCECSDAVCVEDASSCTCAGTFIHDDDIPKKRKVSTCHRADWEICCRVRTSGGAGRPCYCLHADHCPFSSDEVVDSCSPEMAAVCQSGDPVATCR